MKCLNKNILFNIRFGEFQSEKQIQTHKGDGIWKFDPWKHTQIIFENGVYLLSVKSKK